MTSNTKVNVESVPLEISIIASTVWGSSRVVTIYSPVPSAPTDIRIFVNFSDNNQTRDIILQHSAIENVTNYEMMCYYLVNNSWEICSKQSIISTKTQTMWSKLAVESDFLFKVIVYYKILTIIIDDKLL